MLGPLARTFLSFSNPESISSSVFIPCPAPCTWVSGGLPTDMGHLQSGTLLSPARDVRPYTHMFRSFSVLARKW